MELSDRDKEIVKGYVDRGEPLPAKYKLLLFKDAPEVELVWQGKTSEVTNVVLPFQSIEHIDEPRAEVPTAKGSPNADADIFASDARGRQSSGWTNKLIWGDNKLVLSSLKNGPLRREIEAAGGLRLIYIDPPFDVGQDFSVDVEIGGRDILTKEASVVEELAYRDTWGRGADSYLSMMYERLRLMYDLMAQDGSIYVHVAPGVGPSVRLLMDEVMGSSAFVNEIVWKRLSAHNDADKYGPIHDTLFFYTKGEAYTWNPQFGEVSEDYIEQFFDQVEAGTGRRYARGDLTARGIRRGETGRPWRGIDPNAQGNHWKVRPSELDRLDAEGKIHWPEKQGGVPRLRRYLDELEGVPLQDIWPDIRLMHNRSPERLGYDTQKPEKLLERIIKASSNEGDLVADFFPGSGTTLAVAEKLGRKWIGCDLGRFAIHTSRKRLIGVQRELKAANKPYRAFEILNLGKYERQYFFGIDPSLPDEQKKALTLQKEEHYLTLILSAYKAERVFQMPPFHGKRAGTMIVVGPVDAPVTLSQVNEIVQACRKLRVPRVDVLGFEFEMGLVPHVMEEAKAKGVSLTLKYIPKDVFDKRAVDKGQVVFYDVAYVEVEPKVKGKAVAVTLKDFGVFYRQDDADAVAEKLKPGGSKVTVESGQVVKVSKDKKGIVTREVLTKKWTDWIDYWAVDFNFESKKEIVRVAENGGEREAWTGNYIFENEWQAYRTRKSRALELTSVSHEYPAKGRYKVCVKVIDIFGNDTTKVVEVRV